MPYCVAKLLEFFEKNLKKSSKKHSTRINLEAEVGGVLEEGGEKAVGVELWLILEVEEFEIGEAELFADEGFGAGFG